MDIDLREINGEQSAADPVKRETDEGKEKQTCEESWQKEAEEIAMEINYFVSNLHLHNC